MVSPSQAAQPANGHEIPFRRGQSHGSITLRCYVHNPTTFQDDSPSGNSADTLNLLAASAREQVDPTDQFKGYHIVIFMNQIPYFHVYSFNSSQQFLLTVSFYFDYLNPFMYFKKGSSICITFDLRGCTFVLLNIFLSIVDQGSTFL